MDNENNYIDDLYSKKFGKYQLETSNDEWMKLNKKLTKTNFFKFSFSNINVYFMLALISLASLTVYLSITNTEKIDFFEKLKLKIDSLQQQLIGNKEHAGAIDTLIIEKEPEYIENKKDDNTKVIQTLPKEKDIKTNETNRILDNDKNLQNENNDSTKIEINSTSLASDSNSTSKPKIQKITRVKKTIFVKKDKVIISDTIVIKDKKKNN